MQRFVLKVLPVIHQVYGLLLLARAPFTLLATLQILRPGGRGVPNQEFFAFGWVDAFFRVWYQKIGRDYRDLGRFGYSWTDGLGLELGPRMYNNWCTYWLLDQIGSRNLYAISYVSWLCLISALVYSWLGLWPALALGALLGGSPLLAICHTDLGKPEMFWWPLGIIALWAGFKGAFLWAGLLWSVIAFGNMSVAFLLASTSGVALSLAALDNSWTDLGFLCLGLVPGLTKTGLRLWQMARSGYLARLASEQSGLWRRGWLDYLDEVVFILPLGVAIAFMLEPNHSPIPQASLGAVLLFSFTMYYLNWRVIYFNDQAPFRLCLLGTTLVLAVITQSVGALVVSCCIAFYVFHLPKSEATDRQENTFEVHGLASRLRRLYYRIGRFPDYDLLRLPRLEMPELAAFLVQIRAGSRILLECDGRVRQNSGLRNFIEWSKSELVDIEISIANDMYSGIAEGDFSRRYLDNFNAASCSPETMRELLERLGVTYVVAFSEQMASCMRQMGLRELRPFPVDSISSFRATKIGLKPDGVVWLFEYPDSKGLLVPATKLELGSTARFSLKAHTPYKLKYRHSPLMELQSDSGLATMKPYKVFPDSPLEFVEIQSPVEEVVELSFSVLPSSKSTHPTHPSTLTS